MFLSHCYGTQQTLALNSSCKKLDMVQGFLDEGDLERYALDKGLPVDYIPTFQAAVLQASKAKSDKPITCVFHTTSLLRLIVTL